MLYKLNLDYDFWPLSAVKAEAARLEREFKIPLEIWRSSSNSYHIRSPKPVEGWDRAKTILEASSCSQAYREVCVRLKALPVRHGEKLIFDEKNNIQLIKLETIRLF
jgi:hypothetical protein